MSELRCEILIVKVETSYIGHLSFAELNESKFVNKDIDGRDAACGSDDIRVRILLNYIVFCVF